MNLRTVVRDCLLLHWDLPEAALPPLDLPLRYEARCLAGERQVAAFALLFFHEGFRIAALPVLRFSYPQFSLAVTVTDAQGVPSLLFRRILVPPWVMPAARFVARQPVTTARLEYDRPSEELEAETWRWLVEKEGSLEVSARLGSPLGPKECSLEDLVQFFRQRRRGYYQTGKGFRYLETKIPEAPSWPLIPEATETSLLSHCLPLAAGQQWPQPQSAVLFPELPLISELLLAPQIALAPGMPQPAASRRCSLRSSP